MTEQFPKPEIFFAIRDLYVSNRFHEPGLYGSGSYIFYATPKELAANPQLMGLLGFCQLSVDRPLDQRADFTCAYFDAMAGRGVIRYDTDFPLMVSVQNMAIAQSIMYLFERQASKSPQP